MAALPRHNMLHFAGHALANDRFPWRSKLLVAGEADGLSLERLMAVDRSHLDLVVLSACRTAAGPVARGEGVINLMRPFLAAGVSAVVGSLWDVDDAATRALMVRFHTMLVQGRAPVEALAEAQRALLASTDPVLQHPRSWAAFLAAGRLSAGSAAAMPTGSGRHQHRRRTLRAG
jgi:CHAT domain-containing protein